MSRADGCPNCVRNTEAPFQVETDDLTNGNFVAYYECHDCGHFWFTSWMEDR